MANWKSSLSAGERARTSKSAGVLQFPRRRQLGLVPLSPSPDPISLAFDAAMAVLSFLPPGALHSGSEEADDLVNRYQNPLQDALGQISAAFVASKDSVPAAQLYTWANQVKQLGDEFYQRTLKYPNKGAGARKTILGIQVGNEWVQQPPDAPGYLTGLLNNILQHAKEAELRQSQMGFDWGSLISGGFDLGGRIVDDVFGDDAPVMGPGGTPYYGPTGGAPQYYQAPQQAGISGGMLLVGGLALLLFAPKIMKAFR